MPHPFLRWWEVALVRLISRSPRIGLILVKQHSGVLSWVVRDRSDEQPMRPCPSLRLRRPLLLRGLNRRLRGLSGRSIRRTPSAER